MKTNRIKGVLRASAALMVIMLLVLSTAAVSQGFLAASAAGKPVFTLEVDNTNAYPGDTVTVTFYVNNDTGVNLTSFSGEISFNGDLFSYLGYECLDNMKDSASHQTVTPVDSYISSNVVRFTFSDSTDTVLVSNAINTPFLRIRLKMIGKEGRGSITGRIYECYSGTTAYGQLDITQKTVTVVTTAPSQTTTQQPAQTTAIRSNDARLSSLEVAPGAISPSFNPEFVAYTVNVANEVANIRISASANAGVATVSGVGVRDLAVGANNFTVTVTAEDGTTRQYGIIVIRAQEEAIILSAVNEGFASGSDVSTTTTTTTAPTTLAFDEPAKTIVSLSDLDSRSSLSLEGDVLKLIGIVFGEIALFFFGFLSGYFIDKNLKNKAAAEKRLAELTRQRGGAYNEFEEGYEGNNYPAGSYVDGGEYSGGYDGYIDGYSNVYPDYGEFDEYGNYIGQSQEDVASAITPDTAENQSDFYKYN